MKRIEDILFGKTAEKITKILVIAAATYFGVQIAITLLLKWFAL